MLVFEEKFKWQGWEVHIVSEGLGLNLGCLEKLPHYSNYFHWYRRLQP